jgi:hypothetical protein
MCYYLTIKAERIKEGLKEKNFQLRTLRRKLINLDHVLEMIHNNNEGIGTVVITTICFISSGVLVLNVYEASFSKAPIIFCLAYIVIATSSFVAISVIVLSISKLGSSIFEFYFCLNRIYIKYRIRNILTKLKVILICNEYMFDY